MVGLAGPAFPPGAEYSLDNVGGVRFRATNGDPSQSTQAVESTAAIGDINRDGVADVTFGTIGLTMPSINSTGGMNSGWPIYTDDSIFSSPALADVNGDGQTDVIIGGDASPGGPVDHRGGILRALNGNGQEIWRFFTDEII